MFVAALLVLVGQAPDAATELPAYDVELVVFENLDAEPESESLPIEDDLQLPEQVIDFEGGERDARQEGFLPLESEQGGLRELVDRLNRSSRYRIIAYRAWSQPGLPFETGIPVRIHGGTDYTGRYTPLRARTIVPDTMATVFPPVAEPITPERRRLEELDGTVTVSLQRYLHVKTDLVFREPLTAPMPETEPQTIDPQTEIIDAQMGDEEVSPRLAPDESSETTDSLAHRQPAVIPGQPYLQPYTLKERRRMRSRELHYFDNPRFGVITLITPYEPEEEPAQ